MTSALAAATEDLDRDGLKDSFEVELLERFRPTVLLDENECAGEPTMFAASASNPIPQIGKPTLYGQVMVAAPDGSGTARLELHYYHLWKQDCGRGGHKLDAEHVAVLVEAPTMREGPKNWRARYWLAAAHQDTACDRGHGAKAALLGATDRGIPVWVSRGKHASFLSKHLCGLGCGGDRCGAMRVLAGVQLIHIGEYDAPLHGAVWTKSNQWPLAEKMRIEFTREVIAEIEKEDGVAMLRPILVPFQAVLLGGNYTLGGMATGGKHTGGALQKADEKTSGALGTSEKHVRKALGGAYGATKGWIKRRTTKSGQ